MTRVAISMLVALVIMGCRSSYTDEERYRRLHAAGHDEDRLYEETINEASWAIQNKRYAYADRLLTEVMSSCPGGKFVDSILIKMAVIKFKLGNMEEAENLCQQIISEYPRSRAAVNARKILKVIEKRKGTASSNNSAANAAFAPPED